MVWVLLNGGVEKGVTQIYSWLLLISKRSSRVANWGRTKQNAIILVCYLKKQGVLGPQWNPLRSWLRQFHKVNLNVFFRYQKEQFKKRSSNWAYTFLPVISSYSIFFLDRIYRILRIYFAFCLSGRKAEHIIRFAVSIESDRVEGKSAEGWSTNPFLCSFCCLS